MHFTRRNLAAAGKTFKKNAFRRIDPSECFSRPGGAVVGQPRNEEVLLKLQRRAAEILLVTAEAVPCPRSDLDHGAETAVLRAATQTVFRLGRPPHVAPIPAEFRIHAELDRVHALSCIDSAAG
jgi:hypothetical protein